MAASANPPIIVPANYDPMFKVDVMLHAPIREHLGRSSDLKVDMMTLSLQLDCLCKQELLAQPSHKIENGKMSSSFTDKASVVLSNLQQTMAKCHNPTPVETFLRSSGLDRLFPHVAELVANPTNTSMTFHKTAVDAYLGQISSMNHALVMARMIHHDISYQGRPKYLAHQLAVLYQAINGIVSGNSVLARHKSNIEENFKALKQSIADISEDEEEVLSSDVRTWIMELTSSIISVITSLPVEMTGDILPLTRVLS